MGSSASHKSNMADVVSVDAVLKGAKDRFKTVEVTKDVDPEFDIGNMLMTDLQPLNMDQLRCLYKLVDVGVVVALQSEFQQH